MSALVDTNVLSELVRARPSARVVAWLGALDEVHISVITIEEVMFGLAHKRNARVQRWFESFFDSACKVVEVSAAIARQAGILRGQLAARGRTRTQADMLIAASAAQHGLSLATRNVRDFADCGIAVVDPWA